MKLEKRIRAAEDQFFQRHARAHGYLSPDEAAEFANVLLEATVETLGEYGVNTDEVRRTLLECFFQIGRRYNQYRDTPEDVHAGAQTD